ncbi:hypothetical protein EVAR_69330_1 [Eumeta japonica]|uniref:Uncharacterized protein n=1 Tax=Eumeta variegata TaxID=151549 RepID=A0A4C2A1L4_EUMVA|nr:hypothetical protein EVAR_69330_1 [Eumeta japonica]
MDVVGGASERFRNGKTLDHKMGIENDSNTTSSSPDGGEEGGDTMDRGYDSGRPRMRTRTRAPTRVDAASAPPREIALSPSKSALGRRSSLISVTYSLERLQVAGTRARDRVVSRSEGRPRAARSGSRSPLRSLPSPVVIGSMSDVDCPSQQLTDSTS